MSVRVIVPEVGRALMLKLGHSFNLPLYSSFVWCCPACGYSIGTGQTFVVLSDFMSQKELCLPRVVHQGCPAPDGVILLEELSVSEIADLFADWNQQLDLDFRHEKLAAFAASNRSNGKAAASRRKRVLVG